MAVKGDVQLSGPTWVDKRAARTNDEYISLSFSLSVCVCVRRRDSDAACGPLSVVTLLAKDDKNNKRYGWTLRKQYSAHRDPCLLCLLLEAMVVFIYYGFLDLALSYTCMHPRNIVSRELETLYNK